MKNFVKHTLAIAICAAALLSSCIKEESYVTQDVILDVQLTRAGTTSEQQGDQIEDIMLWAFERNSDGSINNNPVGWRQFKAPNPTFTQLSLHLPVKMCGTDGAKYRIIAVLNTQKFTDADGNAISFNGSTTYTALTTGKFVSKTVMDSAIEENKPGTPAVMPVSHWADVDVAQSNVHDNNACASVSIDVFRTVAKTQFFMGGKSGAEFDLKVTELSLHCGAMPTNGLILSSLAPDALNNKNTTPAWFGDSEPTIVGSTATDADKTITLVAADAADVAVDGEAYFHENRPAIADNETAANHYKLIGSHFLYENPEGFTFTDNATSAPEGDGYYYKVVYEADNQPYTRYVALPSILRNHDYQIHALVEGGSGELTFTIEVVDWDQENIEMKYENTVTIADNGYISWIQLPEKSTSRDELESGKVTSGQIDLTYEDGATAKCTFALQTPQYGTWHAELRTLSGVTGNIVFVDRQSGNVIGTSTKGDISDENGAPQQAELIIKNVGNNLATGGSTGDNVVELRIYATGIAGVYQIPNLPGVFKDDGNPDTPDTEPVFAYYTLTQPRN